MSLIKLARIGDLVIVEHLGDRAKGKPRRYTAYQAEIEPGEPFKLEPGAALFVLSKKGFYSHAYGAWALIPIKTQSRYRSAIPRLPSPCAIVCASEQAMQRSARRHFH